MDEYAQTYKELLPGTALNAGKYIIEKKIGEGGFGITYKAVQTGLNRAVCIKEYFLAGRCVRNTVARTIQLQGIDEEKYEKYRQAFVKEAQTLATLHHPNIVEVIDIFDENNTSYMVMPFIEGRSLQSIVHNNGPVTTPEAINYMAQVADAVRYLHEKHLLHRDIKPENIMITAEYKAILIDFGSAREFQQDKTQMHTSMLTHGYAPPEQYTANSRKGSYTDIYALGASLYYILTGQVPLEAAARTTEEMVEPKMLNPKIPDEVNQTIMKAMQLKTTDRYQTVGAFMDDLRNTSPNNGSSASAKTVNLKNNTSASANTVVAKESSSQLNSKKPLSKWLIIGIAAGAGVFLTVLVVVLFVFLGHSKKAQQSEYEEVMSFYRRGVQSYQQGMNNTQGQLAKFQQALVLFDSAQLRRNSEFQESYYVDSINVMRGNMYDYCLAEAKRNFSGAFLENGLRQNVLNYLKFAKQINDNSEVNTLIDSIQYIYISED